MTAMKLYDLPAGQNPRPKIYGLIADPDGWVEFDHLDGMYSYCVAFDSDGNELGVCHLQAWTPLKPCLDGYAITSDSR
jgi:hypothetical protein